MDNLSKLAHRERARLVSQTTASGSVSKEDFEALDRLEKLAAGDRSWRQWWIPACAFLLPLALVSFLIEMEQRETQIDLDAKVSAFSATLRDKQPLFDGSLLRALNATGLEGVDNLSAGDGDCSVAAKLDAKPRPEDAINLQLLEVPRGWRVRLEHSGNSIDLTFPGPPARPEAAREEVLTTVSLGGGTTVETRCGGVRNLHEFKAADISSLNLRLGPRTTLSLTPADGHPLRFARQIAVEKLALVSEEISFANAPENRQVYSVLSGTLYLNALDGKQVVLRPSEALSFSDFSGTLRSINPAADGLQLELFATVKCMKIGEAPNQRSLMPTYLQWIAARNELWLWWGSAVSAFAALMSVLRWLKIAA
jgi:hypothetical protein